MGEIGNASFAKVTAAIEDPNQRDAIQLGAFESALDGIRNGLMTYKNDPLLPILQSEVNNRTTAYANLSNEEEGALLSLSAENKKVIAGNDRRAKEEFLTAPPSI